MSYFRIGSISGQVDRFTGLPTGSQAEYDAWRAQQGKGPTPRDSAPPTSDKNVSPGGITGLLNTIFGSGTTAPPAGGGSFGSGGAPAPGAGAGGAPKKTGITLPLIGTIPTWLALAGAAVVAVVVVKKLKGSGGKRRRNPGSDARTREVSARLAAFVAGRRRRRRRIRHSRKVKTIKQLKGPINYYGKAHYGKPKRKR